MTQNEPPRPRRLTIGAVFATYNRAGLAVEAAEALLRDSDISQVVVVDDGSTDFTVELLDEITDPRLSVLRQPQNTGRTSARQRGIDAITTDVILLLDDDVIAEPGLGAAHLEHHQRNYESPQSQPLLIVGYMPTTPTDPRSAISRIYANEYEGAIAKYKNPQAILDKLWGGNVSYPRPHLQRLHRQLPRGDSYHEDRLLGHLARDVGFTAVFDREARAIHKHTRSFRRFCEDAIKRGRANKRSGYKPTLIDRLLAFGPLSRMIYGTAAPIARANGAFATPAVKIIRRCAFSHGLLRDRSKD